MAHRKPLGTTCRTTFDWQGERPTIGAYLVSQAGTWYRVCGVEEKKNPAKIGLLLERIAGPDVVAAVFAFEWYARNRARSMASE